MTTRSNSRGFFAGSSPDAASSFLSGSGAGPTGRSGIAVARYKGEAEKALIAAGFPRVYLFRPAHIYPVQPRKEPNLSYRLLRAIHPAFRVLFPNEGDVATVRRTLGRISSPAILVGHSYGGNVITAAGTDARVAGLVYIAALAPDADETSQSQQEKFPVTDVFKYVEVTDGRVWMRPDRALRLRPEPPHF